MPSLRPRARSVRVLAPRSTTMASLSTCGHRRALLFLGPDPWSSFFVSRRRCAGSAVSLRGPRTGRYRSAAERGRYPEIQAPGGAAVQIHRGDSQTDIVAAGIDKGTGLRALAELMGDPGCAFAVGDAPPDIPMFACARLVVHHAMQTLLAPESALSALGTPIRQDWPRPAQPALATVLAGARSPTSSLRAAHQGTARRPRSPVERAAVHRHWNSGARGAGGSLTSVANCCSGPAVRERNHFPWVRIRSERG